MKVKDLYNKIAKGEELPYKIKVDDITYYLCKGDLSGYLYFSEKYGFGGDFLDFSNVFLINKEVKIIADTPKENEKIDISLDDTFIYQRDITGIENLSIRPEDIELKLVKQLGCMPYENEINYETGEIKINQGYDLTDVGNKLNQLILRYNLLVTKYDSTKEKKVNK